MSEAAVDKIIVHEAPGEVRAVALLKNGQPGHLFSERWNGVGGRARYGETSNARIRKFADELSGAFLELTTGEEVFLRLKSRAAFTEGALVRVKVESEARTDKLARVSVVEGAIEEVSAFERWRQDVSNDETAEVLHDRDQVDAAFDEAVQSSVTLPKGGQMHIERTRALTAFDIDTAGRSGRGSAGARALAINREAAQEMARQVSLRGLGGNLVLDCVAPLNASSRDLVQAAARSGFEAFGVKGAKVLKPSTIGLLEASIPWRTMPLQDQMEVDRAETELLAILRDAQREADANPMQLYELSLGRSVWQAYQARQAEVKTAIEEHFGTRLNVTEASGSETRMIKR